MPSAVETPGWMSLEELHWLEQQASSSGVIIELGSWMGRSTLALCQGCPGLVFAVDHFQGAPGCSAYVEAMEPGGPVKVRRSFLRNTREHIESGRLLLVEKDTRDALPFLEQLLQPRGGADMIFIDADHSQSAVMHDIHGSLRILRGGGLLAGHDFNEVKAAVMGLLPDHQRGPGSLWYWRKS